MEKDALIIATVTAGLMGLSAYGQGNLAPTSAPAPTMKTLQQVEPRTDVATLSSDATSEFRIFNSGSYYLSSTLKVNKLRGISITGKNVTLDLNGFDIVRASGSGGDGIFVALSAAGVTIRNGAVSGFNEGINAVARSGLYENLALSNCDAYGMDVGQASVIRNCRAFDNAGSGIRADDSSTIKECTAHENLGTYGITAGPGSVIDNCSARENQGSAGIFADFGSTVQGCNANNNIGTYGIRTSTGSLVVDCVAQSNVGTGPFSYGIDAGADSSVIRCVSSFNNNTNTPASASLGIGINVTTRSTVKDCTATNNEGDGIRLSSDCFASGNVTTLNGNGAAIGAGIHAIASDSRIEGNTTRENDIGIDVDGVGNLIIRNSAGGNGSNYEIVANNHVGAIVITANSAAISGNTGGSGVGSTDPWANFTF